MDSESSELFFLSMQHVLIHTHFQPSLVGLQQPLSCSALKFCGVHSPVASPPVSPPRPPSGAIELYSWEGTIGELLEFKSTGPESLIASKLMSMTCELVTGKQLNAEMSSGTPLFRNSLIDSVDRNDVFESRRFI